MSENNTFFKPSFSVESLLGEVRSEDSEMFTLFMKAYYEWLQTSTIQFINKTGTFVRDEIIIGNDTFAKAIIKEVKTNYIVIRMLTNAPFNIAESFTASTSGATATIQSIKDNVIRKTGQILNYRDITKTVDKYVDYLKEELNVSFPNNSEANKRLVTRKYKDFLQNKGNEESYRFLFRAIYDEKIDIKYPSEEILRVSDGNFEKTKLIRTTINPNIFNFLNQTIRGRSSNAIGNVIDIKLVYVGTIRVAELTLSLVSGTFQAHEIIEVVNQSASNTEIYGMITDFQIVDGGSGYQVNDVVSLTSATGIEFSGVVSSIQESPISSIKVNTRGHGYRLNTEAVINNSGTGGSGLIVRVTELANTYSAGGYTVGETSKISIINRGSNYYKTPTITLTDSVITSLGMLSDKLIQIVDGGTNYAVGDALVFTGGAGSSAAGNVASVSEATTYDLLFEDGFRMKSDGSYYDIIKNEDWNVTGSITRLELTNFGTGYTTSNLPTISVTSGTGSSANLVPIGIQGSGANVSIDVANNVAGIGSIRKIEIKDFGVDYYDASIDLSGTGDGNANVIPVITGLGIKDGNWITDDGKIDYKIIQDSYYYQEFSYVIRSGLQLSQYSEFLKTILHPSGFQLFGEILVETQLNLAANFTSTIETLANITSYVYFFNTFIDASSINLPSEVQYKYEIFKNSETPLNTSIERSVILEKNIDVSDDIDSYIKNELSVFVDLQNNLQSFLAKHVILEKNIDVSDDIDSYIKNELSVFVDLQNNLQSFLAKHVILEKNIDVSPIISSVIDILQSVNNYIVYLKSIASAIVQHNSSEYIIYLKQISVNNIAQSVVEYISQLELVYNVSAQNLPSKNKIEILKDVNLSEQGYLTPDQDILADQLISTFSSNTISLLESYNFLDGFGTGLKTVYKNIKINGTITITSNVVFGTGTAFNSDFVVGDSFIVENEKFIINSIANTIYMTINVPPSNSYNDVNAYKEIFAS